MKTATIRNCKTCGVRKDPTDPNEDDVLVDQLKVGTKVQVDPEDVVYNWQGRKFLKVKLTGGKEGYICRDLLEVKGVP